MLLFFIIDQNKPHCLWSDSCLIIISKKRVQMNAQIQTKYFAAIVCTLISTAIYAVEPNTVVATINVGVTPDAVAITPNGKYAYVANNNNYGITDGDTVSVIDLKHNLVKQTIFDASFDQPFRIAINPAGTKAYVANSNSTTLSIIDTATNTVTGVIGGFDGPSGMVISPDGTTGYVNNYGGPEGVGSGNGNTVTVVDLVNNVATLMIIVGKAPAALAMSPDGEFVYVIDYVDGNPGTGLMQVIQTSNNMVIATVTGFSGPFGIAITPCGKYAYITDFGSNNFDPIGTTVSVVKLSDNMIVDTIDLGIQPAGIAITPNGKYAYVTNFNGLYAGSNFTNLTFGEGTVNIIDLKKNEVITPTIVVGQGPSYVAMSPCGKFAYVTNFTSNTVNVIALSNHHHN